jgi:hypothetical protein
MPNTLLAAVIALSVFAGSLAAAPFGTTCCPEGAIELSPGFQPLQSCSSSLSILLIVWQVRSPLMLRLAVHLLYVLLTNNGQNRERERARLERLKP